MNGEEGLHLNFTLKGSVGKRCFEKIRRIDPNYCYHHEIVYLRIQVLNTNPVSAKGCIGKCEVRRIPDSEIVIPRERFAWQHRTTHDAVEPIDILPNDHEFLVIAWSLDTMNDEFTFATRNAYLGVPSVLPSGKYNIDVEVISENVGSVKQRFTFLKGNEWDKMKMKPIGSRIRTPSETTRIGRLELQKGNASDARIMEFLVAAAYESMGYEIETTHKGPDPGIDLIMTKDDKTLLIEVKSYQESLVPRNVVAQLAGISSIYKGKNIHPVLVTSTGFTKSAKKFASSANPKIELLKVADLLKHLDRSSLDSNASELVDRLLDLRIVEEERSDMLAQRCQEYRIATGIRNKGRALEALAIHIFESIPHCNVRGHNIKTDLEEIDLLVANESSDVFFRDLGNPFFVECKNWTRKTKVREIRVFSSVMASKSVHSGVFIAAGGYTRGHKRFIREIRQKARTIIPLDGSDIESVCQGLSLADLMRDRFYESYKW